MNRSHQNPKTKFVYEAAEYWRDNCLLQDGSVFSDRKLWTGDNLHDDFENRFVGFIVPTDDPKYKGKSTMEQWMLYLEHANSGSEIYQFMAEALWVMYLANSGITPKTKKKNIQTMWEKSGTEFPGNPQYLQDQHLRGIGRAGAGFNINMWFEIFIFILSIRQLKNFSPADRERLLINSDGKELSRLWDGWPLEWRQKWPQQWQKHINGPNPLKAENRQIRHMLLHLLFPDHFERVFTGNDKRKIAKVFKNMDPSGKSWTEMDETLETIRKEQEKIHGTDIDFYRPPLHGKWQKGKIDHTEEKVDQIKNSSSTPDMLNIPLNQIFYGPPGTGKTYRTINAALGITDPGFYKEHSGDRETLLRRFNQLKKEGQIEFVTFHQSFGYEEFVEGIRPVMDGEEGGDVSFEIMAGVFKKICERAVSDKPLLPFEGAIKKLKEECAVESESGEPVTMTTPVQKKKRQVWYVAGRKSFAVKTMEGKSQDSKPFSISFDRLRKIYQGLGEEGTGPGTILNYLKEKYGLDDQPYKEKRKNCVLIIDEINRGNISRIFGELITLIEESKRLGEREAATVTLPYSRESFGVPNNLYIIGTMNTADRSIALLDTALRRRFRFQEMMPDGKKLEGVEIDGVSVPLLLNAMNERIESLYDRDHQIGHSNFMRLKDSPDIETLDDIFRHEILPLLQEYFYDDWAKIDLVLNRNGFLKSEPPAKLPGNNILDADKMLWKINPDQFTVDDYKKIYQNRTNE